MAGRRLLNESQEIYALGWRMMSFMWQALPYLAAGGATWYVGVSALDSIAGTDAHAQAAEAGLFYSTAVPLGIFVIGLLLYAGGTAVWRNQASKLPKSSGHH